jgi:hypothetical protein
MKNILTLIVAAFVFIGCTSKVETDVKPYITLYQNDKQEMKIDFLGVNDKRTTKITSTILNDNEIYKEYPLSADVKNWYTEAFKREFKNADMLAKEQTSNITVLINIKNIDATYKKYSLDTKNMQANVKIELIITKDEVTITSEIQSNQSKYIPMILDAEGFESIINESMRDSVSKTVEILIKKIKG